MALVDVALDEWHVALVRLNSPETRNSLGPEMQAALITSLERCDADPEIRCIVIAGSDEAFAAPADIRRLAGHPLDAAPDPEEAAFWARLAAVETPLVAAVSGYALGAGCELALACDMIVADEQARFGLPEVTLGIIPGGGGTQRLTRAIGKQRAMEFVLTGRQFNVKMALRWGLVNKAIPKKLWLTEAVEEARTVAARPPLAARLAKRAILAAEQGDLAAGIETERELLARAMASEDRVEAMTAFLEKREPELKGR